MSSGVRQIGESAIIPPGGECAARAPIAAAMSCWTRAIFIQRPDPNTDTDPRTVRVVMNWFEELRQKAAPYVDPRRSPQRMSDV